MASHAYDHVLGSMTVRHVNGQLVDVVRGEIYPACVNFREGRVVKIERKISAPPRYILPGLIDAHVHIERSLLTPHRFAEMVVVHGTAAVVADPREVANVAGRAGVEYMLEDGRSTPLRFYLSAPSSSVGAEGQTIGWEEVRDMLSSEDFVSLGEVANVEGVLGEDPAIMSKIEVATQLGKRVDGHAPGLSGYDLDRYIMAGISNEHECADLREAEEKHRKGMMIMVREGSAGRDLDALLPFAVRNKHILVTGGLEAGDLAEGHMDSLLRKAVGKGMDPMHAVRAATLWPAEHYGLRGGSVEVDGPADMTVVSDLTTFRVLETWIGGQMVAKDGTALFMGTPTVAPPEMSAQVIDPRELRVTSRRPTASVRAIQALPGQVASGSIIAEMEAKEGVIDADPSRDILLIAVVGRHRPAAPAVAFINGFGLYRGAMASSVSLDSHNLVGVGTSAALLAQALNAVVAQGGGYYATDGVDSAGLELPVLGLMTAAPWHEAIGKDREVTAFLRSMGCPLPAPFVTLSYQTLLTAPELKMGDLGLVDTIRGIPVSPVVGEGEPVLIRDTSP